MFGLKIRNRSTELCPISTGQVARKQNNRYWSMTDKFRLLCTCFVLCLFCVDCDFTYYEPNYIESTTQQSSKYIVWLKTLQAVDTLRSLSQEEALISNTHGCDVKVECDSYFESALFGGYCDLTCTQMEILRHCFREDLLDFQLDANIYHQSASRKLTSNPKSAIQKLEADISEEPEVEQKNSMMVFLAENSTDATPEELTILSGGIQDQIGFGPGRFARYAVAQISQVGFKDWPLPLGLWNLDRIDQRLLPLNRQYLFGGPYYVGTGKNVTIYVVDSGIRANHTEFQDWDSLQQRVGSGLDTVDNDDDASDCDGHGTHVASIAVGRGVGVAKQAEVVAVRVLDCQGAGKTGNLVAGLDWVSSNAKSPAIVTLSLGLEKNDNITLALETIIRNMVEKQNITFIVASGNSAQNLPQVQTSCDISPAYMSEVITVAASDLTSKFGQQQFPYTTFQLDSEEGVYQQGNTGECVDIFAPGVDIYGACGGEERCTDASDTTYTWQSGTSMAVPHVAGAAAIFLSEVPHATPAEVKKVLMGTSTTNRISSPIMQPGTKSNLLYVNIQEMINYYNLLRAGVISVGN
eukprot:TRINITY_DN2991_c1_g1_i2.p1 TRINITY_DN2991_c1_g1~~TRINITY_DN2991_c1_g1_i2.p1  ORF type:complete len:590 (-),score=54.45 TRINITY_DN2991_c1_g1_i2:509-2245(-)